MFDVVLRNGLLVDGTGAAARIADIGIREGRIARIGQIDADEADVWIDARGLAVAPGFIDLHSHYDAQVFWDPLLTPSCQHGVTTVISGNCGLTLAPAKPEDRDFLTRLLARVEAIPVETLLAGIPYGWESYPELLDVIERQKLGPNMGLLVGHSALRRAVMGKAASERAARPDEIAAMVRLLDDALEAGGFGFSTANVSTQIDGDGRPIPPNFATREEFIALAGVCAGSATTTWS